MSVLDQVQRGVDFVEAHLDEDFPLTAVSRAGAMSHWHFQRTFRALTGETLMTYVRARRLARAADRLLHDDTPLIELAMDAGFSSQEAFTRAFKRAYGLPPGRYRSLGRRRLFVEKVGIDASYLAHLRDGVTREPRIVERGAQAVIGLSTHYYGVDSEKNDLAERIPALWDAFLPRLAELPGPREACFGLIRARPDSEELTYLACAEVPPDVDPPQRMVRDTIPASTWAVFEHRGPTADLDHTVNYVYGTWLAGSDGWTHTTAPDLEIYGARWHPTSPDSVIEYAVPVARR